MSERATVFETTQIGVEVTSGTGVTCTKRLLAVSIEPKPMVPVKAQRNMGSKFTNSTFNNKEWTQADMKGEACFRTLSYLLSGIITTGVITTPGGGTNSRLWTFQPNTYSPDSPKTFTIESGSSAGAESFPFGVLDSLAIRYTKDEVGISGTWFGQSLAEGISLSNPGTANEVWRVHVGSADGGSFRLNVLGDWTVDIAFNANSTTVANELKALETVGNSDVTVSGAGTSGSPWVITFVGNLAGTHVALAYDDALLTTTAVHSVLTVTETTPGAGISDLVPIVIDPTMMEFLISTDGSSYTQLDRVFEAEWSLNNRFAQVMTLDDTKASFSAVVEKPIAPTCSMVIEHNTAAAAYMAGLRAKTDYWFRILATGPVIEGSLHYLFQIDFPFHFKDNSRGDKSDVWCSTYHLEPLHNASWQGGAALRMLVQNDRASL